ncbi:hypothetical protein QAD02_017590 [Eretmocerus hayati]|uniref:Uncharacterized protein n=1 Tax=Eretmocerus hayati TaxID=131215 RepID=A0ACC2PFG8_9HYME|nr:hypothetical protein QAD02_017590 [Eretmocerus hayati]
MEAHERYIAEEQGRLVLRTMWDMVNDGSPTVDTSKRNTENLSKKKSKNVCGGGKQAAVKDAEKQKERNIDMRYGFHNYADLYARRGHEPCFAICTTSNYVNQAFQTAEKFAVEPSVPHARVPDRKENLQERGIKNLKRERLAMVFVPEMAKVSRRSEEAHQTPAWPPKIREKQRRA